MAIVSKTRKTGKALENKLQVYFDACISAFDFSGAAAISKDGKRIWTGIAGHANLEHGVPNTENTKFRLASVTKPFTAIAILQLQEKGKLKISDPISKYFKKAPRNWKGITIQNLLTHTSGIPSYTDFPEFDVRKRWTPTEIVETVIARPLDFKPGEKFYYCNTGYVLLGIVIESVSGKTYEEYLRDHIFKPSGMRNSGVDNNTMVLQHRAQGYRRDSAQRLDNANYLDMSFPFSAGSLYSTLEDLLRFDTALSGGKLLKQSTIEAMLAPGEANYALGWTVEALDGKIITGHAGGIDGFTTIFERIPEDGYCTTILSNVEAQPVSQMAADFRSIIFGKPFKTPKKFKAVKVDPAGFKDFEGEYELAPGFIITITREDDSLMAQASGQEKLALIPSSSHQFFFARLYAQISFNRDKNGRVTDLILHQNSQEQQAKRIAKRSKTRKKR